MRKVGMGAEVKQNTEELLETLRVENESLKSENADLRVENESLKGEKQTKK